MNIIIVVANNFNKTAQQNGVIVFDELLEIIKNKKTNDIKIVAGQGINDTYKAFNNRAATPFIYSSRHF